MSSVWADRRYVARHSGYMTVCVFREHEVLAIWRPVLLDSNVETERRELEYVAPVNI